MTDNSVAGLCRLTVRAPSRIIDLAVPADVPVADLLPTVLRYAGENLEENGLDHGGWVLQRLGRPALDGEGTLETLELRDGEVLYLRPYSDELPEVRLDDLVDGIATVTRDRQHQWSPEASRRLLRGLVVLALVTGLVVLAWAGGPVGLRVITAAVSGVLLLAGAASASRAVGDTAVGATLGFMAVPYLMLAGWLLPGGDISGPNAHHMVGARLLAAAAAGAGGAALAAVAVGTQVAVFLAAALVAVAAGTAGAVMIGFDLPLAAASAAVGALLVIFGGFVPAISFKLAGMRMPALPTNAQQLQEDIDPYDPRDVTTRTVRAGEWMTALYGATGAICVGCLTALLAQAELPEVLTASVLTALLLLHGRGMVNVWQRLALVLPGAWGLILLALAWAKEHAPHEGLVVVAALLMVTALLAVASWTVPGRRIVPHWGRAAELLQSVLAISLLPLTLWTLGVYGALRALNG
ncbi:type VII secretion integral membrane protein EccD [Streptomyces sp. NBC_01092]|uniref:type VII secretion integral membrane protein EccD n=1 Tax=Streptomyces sp. NBC_01092 TaxID=2903748 RepID=UPI00386F12AE|nr:type VII secretion integral membrane protein EccD [Streptomyces sp. NBC_01092]